MNEIFSVSSYPAPSITDWIGATIAILGLPFVIWSFIKLITKDEDKQRRLAIIEDVAINQHQQLITMQEQVEELANQTSEFKHQTNLMFEANEILSKQLELQISIHENSKNIEQQKADLENKKHLQAIRPYFKISGGSYSANEFTTKLTNEGSEAHNVKLTNIGDGNTHLQKLERKSVNKNETVSFSGKTIQKATSVPSPLLAFETYLEFSDEEGNMYLQKISRGNNKTVTIDFPKIKNR